ncbi:hypothetical protein RHAB21_01320 [Pseudorhizobium halotolerans]|uniref:Restriction endonuclease n=1 Tax=Pseudorhizobium halotolerans TaxID=1233081 RepID=A0ABN7JEI2_9HYPH|nr:hypothetical protein [Pseudorhizobium halotolerans]CAD7026954.1 hypothetical protein RHAB21_01320 [Pseudorhizobium halotolerans]
MTSRHDQRTATIVELTSAPTRRKRGRPSKASLVAAAADTTRPPDQAMPVESSSRSRSPKSHPTVPDLSGEHVSFDCLINDAMTAIEKGPYIPDQILGRYAPLASLLRSVSFHEGRLLERGLAVVAALHPDLQVLGKPLKLPLVEAAVQAISTNSWDVLEGVCFDCDIGTERTYKPDLIILNRKTRKALVIDLKRSLAAYSDSTLADLTSRMMATGLILPDFLYKRHKRLSITDVDIAVIDGASRKSNHDQGIWKLTEVDELLDLPGAAAAMERLRSTFGERARALIESQALGALGLQKPPRTTSATTSHRPGKPDGPQVEKAGRAEDGRRGSEAPIARIVVGFARSASGSG